jgi:glycerate dehydrogenase
MGIIGGGALGRATAELAKALGMNVVFAERKGAAECRDGYVPFETVLKQADVISLHCPLSEETRNMVAEQEFAQMKPNTILINTGRGGLVDEIALVDALKKRQIAGAGVDVFTQEPADIDNPLLAGQ